METWEHPTKSGLGGLLFGYRVGYTICSIYHSNWFVYTDNDIIFIC